MNIQRYAGLALAVAIAFVSLPSIASAAGDPMSAIHSAAMAFNRGDLKGWAAACASPAQITDDFPPHVWNGPTACTDWVAAYLAFNKKEHITNVTVIFGTPWHVAITGNVAYVVLPAALRYNVNGKPVKENGSVMTIVLQKTAGEWLMTAWTWAQH